MDGPRTPEKIKPYDPWVATYLAERVGGTPVAIETQESERRATLVYLGFWRETPLKMVALYAKRIPKALADYSVFGAWGAGLWIALGVAGIRRCMAHRDFAAFPLVVGPFGIACCLVVQVVVIDTRYIYAYPLNTVSAIAIAAALGVLPTRNKLSRACWGA